ncbi:MAG: alkaline phosphatase family protein [Armatimonadota bacterium]
MFERAGEFGARHRFAAEPSWVMPAYGGESLVNLVSSLLRHFGIERGTPLGFESEFAARLAGKRKIMLMIVDGLGWMNLAAAIQRMPVIGEVFSTATRWPITSVFPSTTVAACTSILTGVPPSVHGMIGYLMFFPEYGRVFNMIGFRTPDIQHEDLLSFGFEPGRYTGQGTILQRLEAAGIMVGPYTFHTYAGSGLSRLLYHRCTPHPYVALGDLLAMSLDQWKVPVPQFLQLYWANLDTIAHLHGANSTAYAIELSLLATALRDHVLPALDDESALLLIADHGHIDGDDAEIINLMTVPGLTKLFRVPPAGEGRSTHLFIRPGHQKRACTILESVDGLRVFTKEAVLASGLLGGTPLHPKLLERIGDLIIFPEGSRRVLYDYQPRLHATMNGRHGGLSPEEMIVPLLLWTR